jgi:hypothetical protein
MYPTISKVPWIHISRVVFLFGGALALICQCVNTHVIIQRLSQSLATSTSAAAWMDLPLSYEAMMRILPPEDTLLGSMWHRKTTTTKVRRPSQPNSVQAASATTSTTTAALQSAVDKVRRIHLLGERNSGTNFLNEALVAAFPGYGAGKDKQYFQGGIPVFEYKHMVRKIQSQYRRFVHG